ncbi:PKD domain-containing protein, partial [Methanosarcina spelaei]|uniref:PKD domain-containing protein n=1 Tax=Methanosarcina spelaei TaxID=1036679 RepID=UPI001140F162
KAGKYTVSLTVKNAAGSSTKTIKNYIVINELKTPVAAFYASPRSGKAPLNVQFTDKSSNSPTSWKWSFGDGTYSTSKSPAHKYSKAGKYTVSLTVKNAKGSNTKTMSGYIIVSK